MLHIFHGTIDALIFNQEPSFFIVLVIVIL